MNAALQSLIDRYQPNTPQEWENALREIVQELALLGLWRAKFFEHAAFYGGTALRIFHGLPRFSEDMDFSLLKPDADFDFAPYLEAVRAELSALGFTFEVDRKPKQVTTAVDSAFIKGSTRINLLEIGAPAGLSSRFPPTQRLKIKLEVDTDPPAGAHDEVRTLLIPIPFQVRLYELPSLFAGKLHATLCRNWKTRIKGRDFFDFIWYLGKHVPCQLAHLQKRMEQTGHWNPNTMLDEAALKERLTQRFNEVDFAQARDDVRPFVRDADALALWSREFFLGLVEQVKGV
ncbi:MAG: nucleotidyl transferase AbiEii/AbiGii toxin family protein [Verrucomicrobiaceae bacterium]|nr:nucleotidyl transferase AbiEii/AbiGii toxin family protein [Verrucomicrobiaceae bacterium]